MDNFWKNIDGNFIPLQMDYDYCREVFMLNGKSDYFDDIKGVDLIPEYQFIFKEYNSGEIRIEKVERK